VLFVVDQDLRAPEVAAIARLMAAGKPLFIVLNKADQFNAADRETVLVSIRAKMPDKFPPAHVVSVAGAPSPVERQIENARGAIRVEVRRPPSDVRGLTNLLNRAFPPAPGRTLRFEIEAAPKA
jgi:GTP-binding protein EngB required for normal cell division